jgi:single-stranded-DNA-specific exonuclease
VVGIVASRVTESFRRPAIVMSTPEDYRKGSARTYGGKDVLAALRECAPMLRGFGGHKHAAGLTIEHARFDEFVAAFDDAVGRLANDEAALPLWVEGECEIDELTSPTLRELECLGPFGPGNPEPVFRMRARAASQRLPGRFSPERRA